MKRILLLLSIMFCSLLTSCSKQSLIKLMYKTPKIDYLKPVGFNSFSDFHKDAIYTVAIIKEAYPRLYEKLPDFDEKSNQFIKKASQTISEKEFDVLLKKYVAILEDGHSAYQIDFGKYDKTSYGIGVFKERESWIISNIEKGIDSAVIGKKIISINNMPIKEIEKKIIEFESGENKYWKNLQFISHHYYPSYWEALGVNTAKNRNLNFIVENDEGFSEFTLIDKEIKDIKWYKVKWAKSKFKYMFKQNNGFYDSISKKQNFAYLQMNTCLDYVCVKSEIGKYTNFITKPIALNFFINKDVRNANFGKFLQSFFKNVHEQKIDNLIIDLSYNSGGDERLGKQLIWYLTENEPEKFKIYLHNSKYYKTLIKRDFKEYNALYKEKHQTDLPKGEVNITEKLFQEPYFEDITKEKSLFFLDKTIPKFKGKVYLLIGPQTFSAGQVLATTIADNHLATIIGKPLGNKPTTQTGGLAFKLPNTKKIISLSYIFMERPDTTKNEENSLFPDLEIQNTFQDLLNGDNKVMEYILSQSQK